MCNSPFTTLRLLLSWIKGKGHENNFARKRVFFGMIFLFLVFLGALTITVPGGLLAQGASDRFSGLTPPEKLVAAQVNDTEIRVSVLQSTMDVYLAEGGIFREEAYQKAFYILVQNTLLEQEAERRGLNVSDEEAKAAAKETIQQAMQDNNLKQYYESLAKAKGLSISSPQFVDELVPMMKAAGKGKKLRDQLMMQAGQDLAVFYKLNADLLKILLPEADISINKSVLPFEAHGIHVPSIEEMPFVSTPLPDRNGN